MSSDFSNRPPQAPYDGELEGDFTSDFEAGRAHFADLIREHSKFSSPVAVTIGGIGLKYIVEAGQAGLDAFRGSLCLAGAATILYVIIKEP